MTIFSAVVAAVFVVLLLFLQFRRRQTPRAAVGSPVDIELSRQRYNNYAFATPDEAVGMDPTSDILQEKTNTHRSAIFNFTRIAKSAPHPHASRDAFQWAFPSCLHK
jgi:two-component system sensor kinase FixL